MKRLTIAEIRARIAALTRNINRRRKRIAALLAAQRRDRAWRKKRRAQIKRRRSPFVVIDNCPVPRSMADAVKAIRARSGARLNSAYRGDQATSLLRRLGKMTQRALFDGWVRRLPGFNPANPPRQSTHELYSDGVAYRKVPRGRPLLSSWKCGLDWSDSAAALAAADALGFDMRRPYSDGREYHHTNFYKRPRVR